MSARLIASCLRFVLFCALAALATPAAAHSLNLASQVSKLGTSSLHEDDHDDDDNDGEENCDDDNDGNDGDEDGRDHDDIDWDHDGTPNWDDDNDGHDTDGDGQDSDDDDRDNDGERDCEDDNDGYDSDGDGSDNDVRTPHIFLLGAEMEDGEGGGAGGCVAIPNGAGAWALIGAALVVGAMALRKRRRTA